MGIINILWILLWLLCQTKAFIHSCACSVSYNGVFLYLPFSQRKMPSSRLCSLSIVRLHSMECLFGMWSPGSFTSVQNIYMTFTELMVIWLTIFGFMMMWKCTPVAIFIFIFRTIFNKLHEIFNTLLLWACITWFFSNCRLM